jgi:sugar/nucleoside kinase (ribokinase family)
LKSKTRFNVVSIGDFVADIVAEKARFPVEPFNHQRVGQITLEPGGAGNFMIAGARLGLQMIALGVVGADSFGRAVVEILQQEGVDTKGIRLQGEGATSTVLVLTNSSGQHVFLGEYGVGAEIALSAAWRESLQRADAVQTWGYVLQESRLTQVMLDGMAFARQRHCPVFFDPGPQVADASPAERDAALASCDVILLTEDEIPLLQPDAPRPNDARALLAHGARMVCVKRGARGCVILTESETVSHPGFRVKVRDTSAAGDSFAAAFIYAYLRNWSLSQIATFANAMGAAKVKKSGTGRQVPTLDEVRRVLADYKVDNLPISPETKARR